MLPIIIIIINNYCDQIKMDSLQKFEKPDKDFLKDKECLICLEPMDFETNQLVQLPCRCANSAYHIDCILKLLNSGKNKNFCPHCKTKYKLLVQKKIPLPKVVPVQNVVSNLHSVPIQNNHFESLDRYIQMEFFTRIILFHIMSNSIMNIIGVCVSINHPKYNCHPELPLFLVCCIIKLMLNYCSLVFSKNNIEKIESVLIFNYMYHLGQFGLAISVFVKVRPSYLSTALLFNQLIFGFLDITFRMITDYKMQNRVTVAAE
jgi:3-hydroxymyristoyl/3-hydroxydecanoyl-(acyl carrier protein) dehydratase